MFEERNFEVSQETNLNFNRIVSGQEATLEIPISFAREQGNSFNLDLLDMLSNVRLVGNYTNNDGDIVEINTTRQVRIIWDASNVDEENCPAFVNAEIITNRIINIGGEYKRVVQARVISGVENNIYPIRETNIEINVPTGVTTTVNEPVSVVNIPPNSDTEVENDINEEINNETNYHSEEFVNSIINDVEEDIVYNAVIVPAMPESITVITYGNMNWTYEENDGNISITIENRPNHNNVVSWNRNGQDVFIITYIYAVDADVSEMEISVTNAITLYDVLNTRLESSHVTSEVHVGRLNITTFNSMVTRQAYRSILSVGEAIEHVNMWSMAVSYAPAIQYLHISDTGNLLYSGEYAVTDINAQYVSSTINRAEFLRMFGSDGRLRIYSGYTLIGVVDRNTAVNASGDIVINYDSNVNSLSIVTSSPVTEGRLNILHTRLLRADSMTEEQIANATGLKYRVTAYGIMLGDDNEVVQNESTMELVAPVSVARLEMDRTTLSTANKNEVRFTITLRTNDFRYDLFTNPVFDVEVPRYIRDIDVRNIQILSGNGLEIAGVNVVRNYEGNQVIRVETVGVQRSYGENTHIVLDVTMATERLMPTSSGYVQLGFQNMKDTVQESDNPIGVKFESIQGMILISSVNNEGQITEAFRGNANTGRLEVGLEVRNVLYTGLVLNNTGVIQENVQITGRMPFEGNIDFEGNELGTTINARLATEILVRDGNGNPIYATIYYSNNKEAVVGDGSWAREFTYEAKSYLIVIDSLSQGKLIEFGYVVEIPENLRVNESMFTTFIVESGNVVTASGVLGLATQRQIDLELEVNATVEEDGVVYSGQEVIYVIEVTNVSNITANNVRINLPVPEGTSLVYYNAPTEWVVDELETGETARKTMTVVVDDIEDTVEIIAVTTVDSEYLPEQLVNSLTFTGEETYLRVNLSVMAESNVSGIPNEVAELGDDIYIEVRIENMSGEPFNNVRIENVLPSHIRGEYMALFNAAGHMIDDIDIRNERNLSYVLDEVNPGEVFVVLIAGRILEYVSSFSSVVTVSADQVLGEGNEIRLEAVTRMVPPISLVAELSSPTAGETVDVGDTIEYRLTVTNRGNSEGIVNINSALPEGLRVVSIERRINEGEAQRVYGSAEEIRVSHVELLPEDTVQVRVVATALDLEDGEEYREISNRVTINSSTITSIDMPEVVTNSVAHLIRATDDTPPGGPGETRTYMIAGYAWLDANRDGRMEQDEARLSEIPVRLMANGRYLPGRVYTDERGRYEFTGLQPGISYVVVFEFNSSTHRVTGYRQAGVLVALNSKAEAIRENGRTVARTNSLRIEDRNITDINIGLIENELFDLTLNQYISRVTVSNVDGTSVHENFVNPNFVKVDIRARAIEGTTAVVRYNMVVANEGEISGYVNSIMNYLPPGLTFSSEMNTNWYQNAEGNLVNTELAGRAIEPGESRTVELTLVKTVTAGNMGMAISNAAVIYDYYNEHSIENATGRSQSEAIVIIAVATGGRGLYASIIIGSMILLGGGIYFINEKVLRGEII